MSPLFSSDVERALRSALDAHAGQTRKGSGTPYISHPMHVALMLARAGADDATLVAGLLHDVVEDCEGWDDARVRVEFGDEVADAVAALTEVPGRPWEVRKETALAHVPSMCARAAAIKAADKIHNMRSLTARLDEAATEEDAWRPFSRGPEATIEFAERLVAALRARLTELERYPDLCAELQQAYDALAAHRPNATP